jgi:hypothetical protein
VGGIPSLGQNTRVNLSHPFFLSKLSPSLITTRPPLEVDAKRMVWLKEIDLDKDPYYMTRIEFETKLKIMSNH